VTATQVFLTGGAPPWQGGASGDYTPALSAIVKLSTLLRGRSHRGRIYTPLVSEAAATGGFINVATVAVMGAAWATTLTNLNADGWPLQVASYKLATATSVQSTFVESAAGTQRRRQGRLRP
jgi:hypothetical protein